MILQKYKSASCETAFLPLDRVVKPVSIGAAFINAMNKRKYFEGDIINGFKFIKELNPYRENCGHLSRKGLFKCPFCGNVFESLVNQISKGSKNQCGCGCNRLIPGLKHGMAHVPEYKVWKGIRGRCNNPNSAAYNDYGGRGIKLCNRWNDFNNFIKDMGYRPTPKHEIDRINNNGNYSPDNCKWSTRVENQNNKRDNVYLLYKGESLTLAQWARRINMKTSTLIRRFRLGWDTESILSFPVDKRNKQFANKKKLHSL